MCVHPPICPKQALLLLIAYITKRDGLYFDQALAYAIIAVATVKAESQFPDRVRTFIPLPSQSTQSEKWGTIHGSENWVVVIDQKIKENLMTSEPFPSYLTTQGDEIGRKIHEGELTDSNLFSRDAQEFMEDDLRLFFVSAAKRLKSQKLRDLQERLRIFCDAESWAPAE